MKRKGNARDLNRWRLFALQTVEYERGRGQKKHVALSAVAAAINGSVAMVQKWEKAFHPHDLGKERVVYQLAAARRAGEMVADGKRISPNISAEISDRDTSTEDVAALAFLAMYGGRRSASPATGWCGY